MPVRQRAPASGILQIVFQPHQLIDTARRLQGTIERNDVPVPKVVAVIALPEAARSGAITEVLEIGQGTGLGVLVVARHRKRLGPEAAPCRIVATIEIVRPPTGI